MRSTDPECTQHSCTPKSVLDLTTKSVKKLVVQPPATVGGGVGSLLSASIHDVFFDSPFTALELSALTRDW